MNCYKQLLLAIRERSNPLLVTKSDLIANEKMETMLIYIRNKFLYCKLKGRHSTACLWIDSKKWSTSNFGTTSHENCPYISGVFTVYVQRCLSYKSFVKGSFGLLLHRLRIFCTVTASLKDILDCYCLRKILCG